MEKAKLKLIAELDGHSDRVWCVAWSPSGQALASCSGDKTIRIWTFRGGKYMCNSILDGAHTRTVRTLAWSPNGRFLASCSFDGSVAVWENQEGEFECIATLEGHENEVKGVYWSASGNMLASCSRDKSIWIWQADSSKEFECLSVLHGHKQDVKAIRWHPTLDVLLSASYDNTIKVWAEQEDDWYCIETLMDHKDTVWTLAFSPDGSRFVSAGDDRTLLFWETNMSGGGAKDKSSEYSSEPGLHWTRVGSVAEAHNGTIYSVDWAKSGEFVCTGAHTHAMRSAVYRLIATGCSDDTIRIFKEGEEKKNMFNLLTALPHAHSSDVNCVAWNPSSGLLASAGDDSLIKIWEVAPVDTDVELPPVTESKSSTTSSPTASTSSSTSTSSTVTPMVAESESEQSDISAKDKNRAKKRKKKNK